MKNNHFTLLCAFILIIYSSQGFGQAQSIRVNKDTVTFSMQTVVGLSPIGYSMTGYAEKQQLSALEQDMAPKLTNLPGNLLNTFEYFVILDQFQFYFQNYCVGRCSREEFLERAGVMKWVLKDTVKLSRKPIRCTFYAMGGVDAKGDRFYVIDANNNNDLGDDVMRPLLPGFRDQDQVIAATVPVTMDFMINGKVVTVKKSIYPLVSSSKRIAFMYPEFKYCKFTYSNKEYFICSTGSMVAILPVQPNFSSLDPGRRVSKGNMVEIGTDYFKVAEIYGDGQVVKLTGEGAKHFNTDLAKKQPIINPQKKTHPGTVSSQVGFQAPTVAGQNIQQTLSDSTFIATNKLKGKYIFIDFWSTACGPCIAEFPHIKQTYAKFSRADLEIIGVVEERQKDMALKILKDNGALWPNIKMDAKGTTFAGYKIVGYPTSYLLDRTGKIVAVDLRGHELESKLKMLMAK